MAEQFEFNSVKNPFDIYDNSKNKDKDSNYTAQVKMA